MALTRQDTGYTDLTSASDFTKLHTFINDTVEHAEDAFATVADAVSDLPATGNWPGRLIWVIAAASLYVWDGTGWHWLKQDSGWQTCTNTGLDVTLTNMKLRVKNGVVYGAGSALNTDRNWQANDVVCRVPSAISSLITAQPVICGWVGNGSGVALSIQGSNLIMGSVSGVPVSPNVSLGPGNPVD